MELETHGIVSEKLGYMSQKQFRAFQERIAEIARMLNGLISSLRTR